MPPYMLNMSLPVVRVCEYSFTSNISSLLKQETSSDQNLILKMREKRSGLTKSLKTYNYYFNVTRVTDHGKQGKGLGGGIGRRKGLKIPR
jgi:hypothetical protein